MTQRRNSRIRVQRHGNFCPLKNLSLDIHSSFRCTSQKTTCMPSNGWMVELPHPHQGILLSDTKGRNHWYNLNGIKEACWWKKARKISCCVIPFVSHSWHDKTMDMVVEVGTEMKGLGWGWLQEGSRRDLCGDEAVLHMTMIQKSIKEICSRCLQQLRLVSRILGDFWQRSHHSCKHVARTETHLGRCGCLPGEVHN